MAIGPDGTEVEKDPRTFDERLDAVCDELKALWKERRRLNDHDAWEHWDTHKVAMALRILQTEYPEPWDDEG